MEWDGIPMSLSADKLLLLMGLAFGKASQSDGLDGARMVNQRLDQAWAGHAPWRPNFPYL